MRWQPIILALALLFFPLAASAATDQSVFSVRDVPVDATAAGSAQARDSAISTGRARAFSALLRRLTLQADWAKLPGPESADLDRLVTGFEVSDERHSATRYLARVSYDFDPEGIRAILRSVNVPFSETRAKPVAVLPVLIGPSGQPELWGDSNLWAAMWRQQPVGQALVPMRVPLGDLEDVSATSTLNLVTPDWPGVQAITQKMGAASAIMPVISLRQTTGTVMADIRLIELSPSGVSESRLSADGADQDSAMLQSIAVVANAVVEGWKQQMVVSDKELNSLTADVSFSTMNQWLKVRQALTGVPFIHDVKIVGLSAGAARVELDYVGSPGQLNTGLQQSDLLLSGSQETGWTISQEGAVPDPAAPALPGETHAPIDGEAASGH